jgi:hypothetical protein
MDLLSEHLLLDGSANPGGLLFQHLTAHVGTGTAVIPAVTGNGQGLQNLTTAGAGGGYRRVSSTKSLRTRKRQLARGVATLPSCLAHGQGEHRSTMRGTGAIAIVARGHGLGHQRPITTGTGTGRLAVSALGSDQESQTELELLLLAGALW